MEPRSPKASGYVCNISQSHCEVHKVIEPHRTSASADCLLTRRESNGNLSEFSLLSTAKGGEGGSCTALSTAKMQNEF